MVPKTKKILKIGKHYVNSTKMLKTKAEPMKNFSDILRQNFKSIQTINNKKLNKIFKKVTQKSRNEHWFTINGNHVLIN